MPDYYNLHQFNGKKVKPKFKPAVAGPKPVSFGNRGQKPAKKAKLGVDNHIKRISTKIMSLKKAPAAPKAAFNRY